MTFFFSTFFNFLKILLLIELRTGLLPQSVTSFFSSMVIGQNKTAGPPGRVAAANWRPLRSLSHLMKTKRTRQIQRSSDNKWDFPASLPLCQNRTMNPSLRNNPRIQQATNFVGRDRQAGEGRFYFDGFERHIGGQETNAAGPRPLIGPRQRSLVCFHLFSLSPRLPAPNACRLPVSPPLTRVLSVLGVAFLRPRQKVRRSRKRGEGRRRERSSLRRPSLSLTRKPRGSHKSAARVPASTLAWDVPRRRA